MRSNIDAMKADLLAALTAVRDRLDPDLEDEWAQIETFCAIALRVFAKTNPSKLRDAAMIEEIKARLDGREVLE